MTMTLPALIILIVIAAICGAVGNSLGGGRQNGWLVSAVLGLIGAIAGPWLAGLVTLPEPLMLQIGGQPFPILWSIIGAALFVALLHLLSGRRLAR